MEYKEFSKIAEHELANISEFLEEAMPDLEIEYMDGVINIFLPNEKQYVINKHFPSLQIWLSSPISGANYFNWDNDKKIWKDKLEHELKTIIYDEIQRNYGPKST